jgi:hypothetical protein
MKTMFKSALICMAACTALMFTSCEDKVTTEEDELEYADFTIEQNKENLLIEGYAVMEKMEDMKGMSFVSTVQDLVGLIMFGSLQEETNPILPLLAPLAKADKNIMSLASLRVSDESMKSLSELFEERGGVYTYNFQADTFDYVPSSTQIIYNFPVGASTTNNGKLTINNYTYQLSTTMEEEFEMPKSLSINLSRNDSTLLSFAMTATYHENDMPKNENTIISFKEGYTFEQAGSYDPQKLSWDFSYSYKNEAFMSGEFNLEGTLDYDSIYSNRSESEDDLFDKYLKKVSGSLQFGNIKAEGEMKYAELVEEIDAYDLTGKSMDTTTYNAYIRDMCSIMNKHVKANLQYADSKKAIAKFMYYQQADTFRVYTHRPNMKSKLVFSDGSAMDESFFATGFEDYNTATRDFVVDLFASYGFDIKVIVLDDDNNNGEGDNGNDDEWNDDEWNDENWEDEDWSNFIMKKLF